LATRNIFKKPSTFFDDIDNLREHGEEKGVYHGFQSLDDYISFKEGCTTIVYGAPYSGKSQFTFEILVNLSEYYGQKHAIYSPETGSKERIAAEIMAVFCRKRNIFNDSEYSINDRMFENAKDFLDKHFFIAEDYEGITVEDFFNSIESIESEYKIKINNSVIDHMGLLNQDLSSFGGREDKWISHALKVVNNDALKNNRHNIVVAHVISQKPIITNGVSWFPPAHPREIAGGQNYFRLGQQIILVYRPPANLPDETGVPYEENAVIISVRKSKPKGIGKLGQVKIFYDWKTNRYYEIDPFTQQISYAKPKEVEQKKIF
jgi:hypothetical protein